MSFRRNPYRTEDLRYITLMGVRVRSKSELTIANRLENRQIPYRYEAELDVAGRHIYPDFVIKRLDGTLVIWEHFGLMNKADYYSKAMEKVNLYRQKGFIQHKNLICTWEEDIAETKEIDNIINRFLRW